MSTTGFMLSAAILSSMMLGNGNVPAVQHQMQTSMQYEAVTIQYAADKKDIVINFEGGKGTAESPYQIATLEQLQMVQSDLSAYYTLTKDIDLSQVGEWTPLGNCNAEGTDADAFSGVFDGKGHTISNVNVNMPEGVGAALFGMVSNKGTVKNLTVENAKVTGMMASGAIIGYNCGKAENLTLKGENIITGSNCSGGIIGGNDFGSITGCNVENVQVNVLGNNDFKDGRIIQCDVAECGGLVVGGSFGGSISACTAAGEVKAEGNEPVGLGGIGGCLEYMDTIDNCHAYVKITAPHSAHAVGGLCGYAGTSDAAKPTMITNCTAHFEMNTPGATHIGGIVGTGLYYKGAETVFSISDCSAYGDMNGAVTPGTISGRAEGSHLADCTTNVMIDSVKGSKMIGTTSTMYESEDQ